ncbi:MAG: amidohydrolase, partial [Synergistaceae bacterium]|nr:amidohydrolase [Synergistaceae bacterium]
MDIGRIKGLARNLKGEIIEMRRHIHMRPEISWHEAETSSFIENKLISLKLDNIKKGFGGTDSGVTAELSGDPSGPCVALRADIDALPINEENALEHRSRNKGAMHACGHDGHTAALLGAAKILSSMKEAIPGKIRFIFQPAEEIGAPSGAQVMIAEGALDGVCMIGGMHLWSFVRTGLVQWRNGPAMASSDRLSVVFTGKGGHGAMPHTAIDPIIAVANYVLAIQTITSREINPLESAVVSIGKIDSGDTFNIIPGEARLMGSLRSFSPDVRGAMEERLRRIADGIASAYRCSAETTVAYMLPSLANDLKATEILRETAEEAVGSDNVEESAPLMVSEDFGLYLKRVPGTFFFLGAGNADKGANFPHHSPRFD